MIRAQHSSGVRDMDRSPPCIREMPLRRTVVNLCHEQHPPIRGTSHAHSDHVVRLDWSTIRTWTEFPAQHAPVSVTTARTPQPAPHSAVTAAAAVAPVVNTSSSSTTELPTGGIPSRSVTILPARLQTRCSRSSPAISPPLPRSRRAGATAAACPRRASCQAHRDASARVCEPPRTRAADRRDGAGTSHQQVVSPADTSGTSASPRASASPSGRTRSRLPRSLCCSTNSRAVPR